MSELTYCTARSTSTTLQADKSVKKIVLCECTGHEVAQFVDENRIPSFHGDIKSPIKLYWIAPRAENIIFINDSDLRKWVKEACEYHKIPHILLALILQNENNPNTPYWRRVAQFGERSITTAANAIDLIISIIPDKVSKGSSGIANVSDKALFDGVENCIKKYGRPPIPTSVKKDILGLNTDTRISGDDWRNDLYYAAAHLRFLIDRELKPCFNGTLSYDDLKKVIKAYNGKGKDAEKYAENAMANLNLGIQKKEIFIFMKNKTIALIISIFIFLLISIFTYSTSNLWMLITDNSNYIPKESNIFQFNPIQIDEGSGGY